MDFLDLRSSSIKFCYLRGFDSPDVAQKSLVRISSVLAVVVINRICKIVSSVTVVP